MSYLEDNHHKLLQLAQEQSLSADQFKKIARLVHHDADVNTQHLWLQRVLIMLAGMCLGLALIFWVAANWDNFSLTYKFILTEAALAGSLFLACSQTRLRVGLLLLSTLIIGGLLALYAQEYSSNSGAWRLFAIWAFMALPLALAARHQAIWMFWWLLILIAASLWWGQIYDYWDRSQSNAFKMYALILLLSLVSVLFYPQGFFKAWLGGAPEHMFRWAVCTTFIFSISMAWGSFFWTRSADFWWVFSLFYMAMLLGSVYGLYRMNFPDKVIFAMAALCLNVIAVGSWVRLFLHAYDRIGIDGWILITFIGGGISVLLLVCSIQKIKNLPARLNYSQKEHLKQLDEQPQGGAQ